jgi:hypothetical protein
MAISKRREERIAKHLEKLNRLNAPFRKKLNQQEIELQRQHDQEILGKIRHLIRDELSNSHHQMINLCKIKEIISLSWQFDAMAEPRQNLKYWFEKYESWKNESKKAEAWKMIRNYLVPLEIAICHCC